MKYKTFIFPLDFKSPMGIIINNDLGGLSFGKDRDGNYGYYGDDDVLVPFKAGKAGAVLLYEIVYSESTPLNTTYEIDCTSLPNYKKLTADNFFAGMTLGFAGHLSGTKIAWGSSALDISSYDAGTGILYVAARTWTNNGSGNSYRMNGKVFYTGYNAGQTNINITNALIGGSSYNTQAKGTSNGVISYYNSYYAFLSGNQLTIKKACNVRFIGMTGTTAHSGENTNTINVYKNGSCIITKSQIDGYQGIDKTFSVAVGDVVYVQIICKTSVGLGYMFYLYAY